MNHLQYELRIKTWKQKLETGSELERVRAEQMIAIAKEGNVEQFVPELAQLVITEVTVYGANKYEFLFMDGSKISI